jgi:glycosyltransferase involved in cell wall biosynthesis
MNVLMLCTKYPPSVDGSYLTSELADAWAADGHKVTVICLQWEAKSREGDYQLTFPSGVNVHYFQPRNVTRYGPIVERLTRWTASSFAIRSAVKAIAGSPDQYDAIIMFAPAVTLTAQILDYVAPARAAYLYITDFFPIAVRAIGLVPGGPVFWVAMVAETLLFRRFRMIGTMSPRNARFLKLRYRLRREQRVVVDPIWGPPSIALVEPRDEVRARFGLPLDRKLLLFGGQLTEGRGLEEVIEAARIAQQDGKAYMFVLIGDGRLRGLVEAAAASCANLVYLPPIPRADYLTLAGACDAGLVVTVKNTDVPTFPSRTIDYLRVGLPIVASVEASTDFGEIIVEKGIGVAIEAGDPERLVAAVGELFADNARLAAITLATRIVMDQDYAVQTRARSILAHATGSAKMSTIVTNHSE